MSFISNTKRNKGSSTKTSSSSSSSFRRHRMLKMLKIGELKNLLFSLLTILIYYCFSIALTFYNRHLFVTYTYPLSITIFHLIVKFLASALIRSVYNMTFKLNKRLTLTWPLYMRRIIPTGIASAADIGLSNWSLQYITISLYTMSKSTVILFIFFFSVLFKLEKWRRSMIFIVLCISSGLLLFTYHSTEFHLFGFLLVMMASISAGLRWTSAQKVTQKKELGLSNPIDMIYHIQPGMIICLLPLAVYVEGVSLITTEKFFRTENYANIFHNLSWVLIGALLALGLESSEYLVITNTSSITLSISGIFKEICTIYLAVIWNHNQLHTMNTVGLIICLAGIIIHVCVKVADQLKATAPSSSPSLNENDDDDQSLSSRLEKRLQSPSSSLGNKQKSSIFDDDNMSHKKPLLEEDDDF